VVSREQRLLAEAAEGLRAEDEDEDAEETARRRRTCRRAGRYREIWGDMGRYWGIWGGVRACALLALATRHQTAPR